MWNFIIIIIIIIVVDDDVPKQIDRKGERIRKEENRERERESNSINNRAGTNKKDKCKGEWVRDSLLFWDPQTKKKENCIIYLASLGSRN